MKTTRTKDGGKKANVEAREAFFPGSVRVSGYSRMQLVYSHEPSAALAAKAN